MLKVFLLFACFTKITESFQTSSRFKRQTQNHCFLPDHPANGEIKILGQEEKPYLPNNDVIANTIIDLSCTNGTVTETGGLSRAICYQGKWKPSISEMGGCVRQCPQVETERDNVRVNCIHKNPKINCKNPIEGTVVRLVCKPFYTNTDTLPVITCRDGVWDREIPPCQPECGKIRVGVQPLIIGGYTAIKSKYPWVAAIYISPNPYFTVLIGGATIISRYFVLSAAHLFTKSKDVLNTGSFIVAAGKHYKDFGDRSDLNAQSSRIKHLYIPNNYGGISQNYTGDLAIVKLEDPFTFTEYVQPVCIDWTNQHEFSALKEDNKGVFAGWGLTKQGGKVSYSLLIVDVPYKSNRTCSIPSKLKNFYTYDKFCAGYSDNQTSVCIGDEGGGLFFRHFDNKFYIRGILSVVPEKSDGCDPNAPALYTKVSTYLQEIETITKLND